MGSCNGVLHAFDRTTGLVLWTNDLSGDGGNNFHGEFLFFGNSVLFSTDGQDGWIYRVALETGQVIWKLYAQQGASAEMVLVESRLYGVADGEDRETVLCVDAETGETLWSADVLHPEEPVFVMGRGPTVIGNALLHAAMDRALHAFDVDTGREVWSVDLGAAPTTGPAVSHSRETAFVGVRDGRLLVIDLQTRQRVQEIKIGGRPYGPKILDRRQSGGTEQLLVHRDWSTRDGALLSFGIDLEPEWSTAPPDTAAWMTARLYPWRDQLVVGTDAGDFFAVDRDTGSMHPLYHVGGTARSYAWHDGTAYFGTIGGQLVAVEPIE